MDKTFEQTKQRILEVVMFENWLRFYFIEGEDENEKLFIRLPEKAMQRLKEDYAHLAGLAENLNGQEITHKSSVDAVCLFVAHALDGVIVSETLMKEIFDSTEFQFELHLFGNWIQNHEKQLDETFLPFNKWQEIFAEWKSTPPVQKHLAEIAEQVARVSTNAPETTQ